MSDINYILSTLSERQQIAQTVANSQSEKLSTIEEGATVDQTADDIKTLLTVSKLDAAHVNVMGSTNSYEAGLVLKGSAAHGNEFLRKDGTWAAAGGNSKVYFSCNLNANKTVGNTNYTDAHALIFANNTSNIIESSSTVLNSDGEFTAPRDGIYHLSASVYVYAGNEKGTFTMLMFEKDALDGNGFDAHIARSAYDIRHDSGETNVDDFYIFTIHLNGTYSFTAGQKIRCFFVVGTSDASDSTVYKTDGGMCTTFTGFSID